MPRQGWQINQPRNLRQTSIIASSVRRQLAAHLVLLYTILFESLPSTVTQQTNMAEIKIDKDLFHERLGQFVSAWKADKRAGDAIFNGASSIVILMGKSEEAAVFHKNNAIHVCAEYHRHLKHKDTDPRL